MLEKKSFLYFVLKSQFSELDRETERKWMKFSFLQGTGNKRILERERDRTESVVVSYNLENILYRVWSSGQEKEGTHFSSEKTENWQDVQGKGSEHGIRTGTGLCFGAPYRSRFTFARESQVKERKVHKRAKTLGERGSNGEKAPRFRTYRYVM